MVAELFYCIELKLLARSWKEEERTMSRRSSIGWPSWDQGNSPPLGSSCLPSFVQTSGSGDLLPIQTGLEHHNHLPPWLAPQQDLNARFGAPATSWSSEGTAALRPYSRSMTGVPFEPYSPPQIVLVSNMERELTPGRVIQFPQGHHHPPRFLDQRDSFRIQGQEDDEDNSRLTKVEQEKALERLKKEIYGPTPKTLIRKVSLYYRAITQDDNNNSTFRSVAKDADEDGKRCAICLDDFNPGTEVMVTPCSHMFHEDCIVPWVKSNGQCPVCRFALCE